MTPAEAAKAISDSLFLECSITPTDDPDWRVNFRIAEAFRQFAEMLKENTSV
ncbi:hypothetical protein [Catellatospora sichuanensis]|uniref:hypothetical protein n=1 Tax=Catellatospora sichuanensis TaxID=1969805 RepID=UPI00164363FB|nr:hypothetical protein [Catellatospora sichuanensis]